MADTIRFQTEYIKICETGNLFDAADSLYMSDSNLSKHMKLLEEEVGHKLFLKCGNKVELTEYGSLYLSFAYKFKALDNELAKKTKEFDSAHSSVVKLAVARSMNCDHIVNMLSDHFGERYPKYSLSPGQFSRTVNLIQTFDMGYELVFAIGSSPTDIRYNSYQWSSDRLIALLPPGHPLADRDSIKLSELADDTFITFPEGSFLHDYTMSLCHQSGFEPNIDFTIHGTRNLAELVSAGLGVSLTYASDVLTVQRHPVSMVEIDPSPKTYLNLYYRKDVPLTNAAKTFLDYAIDIHKNHSADIPYQGPEGAIGNVYFK